MNPDQAGNTSDRISYLFAQASFIWRHPQHVVSLIAVGFAIPAAIQLIGAPSKNKNASKIQQIALLVSLQVVPSFIRQIGLHIPSSNDN